MLFQLLTPPSSAYTLSHNLNKKLRRVTLGGNIIVIVSRFLPFIIMLNNSVLTAKLSFWKTIPAPAARGMTMDGEDVADDQQPYNSNDEDDFYLGQMNVDDEALQIQANNQLAAERKRASGISRRAERASANNDDDEDTDDSRTGEAAEARNVPRNDSDSETEIGRRRGLSGISQEGFANLHAEDDNSDAAQSQRRPARKQPVKQPLRHPRAKAADTNRLTPGERKVRTLPTRRQLAVAKHEAAEAKWEAGRARWARRPENKGRQYHVPKPVLVQPRRTRSGSKLTLTHFYCFVTHLTPYCVTQMRYP